MSGGSYDYFYSRCPEQLRRYADELEHMAERCAERAAGKPEQDYRTKTDVDLLALGECGVYLRAIAWRMRAMSTLLEKWERVTQDVEWWASGDTGIDSVVESFKKLMAERAAAGVVLPRRQVVKKKADLDGHDDTDCCGLCGRLFPMLDDPRITDMHCRCDGTYSVVTHLDGYRCPHASHRDGGSTVEQRSGNDGGGA